MVIRKEIYIDGEIRAPPRQVIVNPKPTPRPPAISNPQPISGGTQQQIPPQPSIPSPSKHFTPRQDKPAPTYPRLKPWMDKVVFPMDSSPGERSINSMVDNVFGPEINNDEVTQAFKAIQEQVKKTGGDTDLHISQPEKETVFTLDQDRTITHKDIQRLSDPTSPVDDLKNFANGVWNTGIAYQINKFLGYETSPTTNPKDYTKTKISIDMDVIEDIGDLGAPIMAIGDSTSKKTPKTSSSGSNTITAEFYLPTPIGLGKKAASGFISGVFAPADLLIVGSHAVVDSNYRKKVVEGIGGMPRQFMTDPIGNSIEFTTSLFGGMLSFGASDTALTKIKGRIRTRGLPEVKPEDIIEKRVLSGEKVFAEYPDELLKAPPEAKVNYLNKANKRVKTVIESKAGAKLEKEYLGLHATDVEFPETTKVLKGSSESPGLYIAPEGSPYFLRLGVPRKPVSTSQSLKSLFGKPKFLRNPTFIAVDVEKVEMFPRNIRTRAEFNKYILSQAGSGKNIATFESLMHGKPEMESIIPPGTILKKISDGVRVEWMGVKVPVRIYRALPGKSNIGEDITKTLKGIPPKTSSSLGIETTPWGTYGIVSGVNSLFTRGVGTSSNKTGNSQKKNTTQTNSSTKRSQLKPKSGVSRIISGSPRYSPRDIFTRSDIVPDWFIKTYQDSGLGFTNAGKRSSNSSGNGSGGDTSGGGNSGGGSSGGGGSGGRPPFKPPIPPKRPPEYSPGQWPHYPQYTPPEEPPDEPPKGGGGGGSGSDGGSEPPYVPTISTITVTSSLSTLPSRMYEFPNNSITKSRNRRRRSSSFRITGIPEDPFWKKSGRKAKKGIFSISVLKIDSILPLPVKKTSRPVKKSKRKKRRG